MQPFFLNLQRFCTQLMDMAVEPPIEMYVDIPIPEERNICVSTSVADFIKVLEKVNKKAADVLRPYATLNLQELVEHREERVYEYISSYKRMYGENIYMESWEKGPPPRDGHFLVLCKHRGFFILKAAAFENGRWIETENVKKWRQFDACDSWAVA